MIRNVVFSLYLLAAAWQDGRKKEIPVWIFWAGGLAALGLSGYQTACALLHGAGAEQEWVKIWTEGAAGSLPGVALLLLGKMTGGAVGAGDGCFFLIAGLFLGLENTVLLLCGSILLCGSWALWLLCRGLICGNTQAGKMTLPFLPFAGISWLGLFAAGWISK